MNEVQRVIEPLPAYDASRILLVMDGNCAICSRAARRIARLDKADRVRIAPAQSPLGAAMLRHHGLDADNPDTWLMIEGARSLGGFRAMLVLFPRLHPAYHLLRPLGLLPEGVQTWLYGLLARNRYRLFGRTDLCAMPDAALQQRLVR